MHQIGLVEHVAVELTFFGVLHQDLRRLAQTGQQLVRRLRGKHHRLLAARPVGADRVIVAVEIVERCVRQPGFVKVQRVDLAVEHLLDFFDVVEDAVVGRLRDRQHARFGLHVARKRVRGDLLLDVLPAELVLRDRSDDAEMVARRHQENGDRAGHDDRMQDRLVAVAIDDDDVTRRDGRIPDNLVRRRRAVGHEIEMISVEDARRVTLRCGHRAGVIEQLTEFLDRVADVGAQHVLAEELVEHLPDRALEKGHAARVSRAMP